MKYLFKAIYYLIPFILVLIWEFRILKPKELEYTWNTPVSSHVVVGVYGFALGTILMYFLNN